MSAMERLLEEPDVVLVALALAAVPDDESLLLPHAAAATAEAITRPAASGRAMRWAILICSLFLAVCGLGPRRGRPWFLPEQA
jgi:hypothetical protein